MPHEPAAPKINLPRRALRFPWVRRSQFVECYGWLDNRRGFVPALVTTLAIGAGILLAPELIVRNYPRDLGIAGSPATENIKASFDLDVVDDETTNHLRDEATGQARRIYDFDGALPERLKGRLAHAFTGLRQTLEASHDAPVQNAVLTAARAEFEHRLKVSLRDDEWAALRAPDQLSALEQALTHLVLKAVTEPLVATQSSLEPDHHRGIVIQRVVTGEQKPSRTNYNNLSQLGDVDAAKSRLESEAEPYLAVRFPDLELAQRRSLAALAVRLVEPNLTLNRAATEQARVDAAAQIKPAMLTIKKGEMIIRDGERLTPRHLMVLRALRNSNHTQSTVLVGLGGATLLLVLVTMAGRLAQNYGRQELVLKARDLVFLASIFLGNLAASKLWLLISRALQETYPNVPREAFLFVLPVAAGAMVVRLVLRAEVALLYSLIGSFMVGLLADGDRMLAIYALVGSVAATAAIRSISARSDLLRAGAMAGVTQMACSIGIQLFAATPSMSGYLWPLPAAFASGVMAGVIALSLTPAVEWLFNYTTDLKLLELANLNHPALKDLIVQAPGSYHHSIIVGALVEAAADSVGANSLLARVIAYYHDLGKGCNPGYFVENQRTGHNPHDKLKPSMSAMIIRRHVTDGIELAKKHSLGEQILDGIAQHHGNTLIQYFYHRAKEQAAETGQTIAEADYRYPGRKPQTREAALVMLGDSIEAASRSLSEPSAARLQGLVTRIISHKFTDGQLEECDLTLRDLHTIAKSFSRVLVSIYHHRMEYPDAAKEPGYKKAAAEYAVKGHKQGDDDAATDPLPDNLRRLGL